MPILRPTDTISPTLLNMYRAHFMLSESEAEKSYKRNGYVHVIFPNAHAATSWAYATGMADVVRFRDLNRSLTDKATLIVACCSDEALELGIQFLEYAGTRLDDDCKPQEFIKTISDRYPGGWNKFISDQIQESWYEK